MAGPFEISPEMLAAAEAAANDFVQMGDTYAEEAEQDAARLMNCCVVAEAATNDAEMHKALQDIFSISHNLKGQGATFGYPLAGRIANTLCELTRPVNEPGRKDIQHASELSAALYTVLHDRMSGDGGKKGELLCARLGVG